MGKQWAFLQPQPYSGKGEGAIAVLGCLVWGAAILLRRSQLPDWTLVEACVESISFTVFAALPLFGLATPWGQRFAQRVLLPRQGLITQCLLCGGLALYLALGWRLGLSSQHFPGFEQLEGLWIPHAWVLNAVLFLGSVFVAARIPFVVLALGHSSRERTHRRHLLQQLGLLLVGLGVLLGLRQQGIALEGVGVAVAYGLVTWSVIAPTQPKIGGRLSLTLRDLGLMVLCAGIIYLFSVPSFGFGVFIAADLFVLVLVYGRGLGREHFGYSFQLRWVDVGTVVIITAIAIAVLSPLALVSGFVQPDRAGQPLTLPTVLSYYTLFSLRVGLFEELFFRAGLMVLFRDLLLQRKAPLSPSALIGLSAFGSSLLFGIVHVGNRPGESGLHPVAYAAIYIVLATLASGFYSLAFARTQRLGAAMLVHGCVDATAVLFLGGFLSVPF